MCGIRQNPACREDSIATQEQAGVQAPVQMLSLGRPGSLTCSFWVVVFKFQAAKLKKEQERLLKQQWELESLEEERKQMEEHRKKKELGYEVERSVFQQGWDRTQLRARGRSWGDVSDGSTGS